MVVSPCPTHNCSPPSAQYPTSTFLRTLASAARAVWSAFSAKLPHLPINAQAINRNKENEQLFENGGEKDGFVWVPHFLYVKQRKEENTIQTIELERGDSSIARSFVRDAERSKEGEQQVIYLNGKVLGKECVEFVRQEIPDPIQRHVITSLAQQGRLADHFRSGFLQTACLNAEKQKMVIQINKRGSDWDIRIFFESEEKQMKESALKAPPLRFRLIERINLNFTEQRTEEEIFCFSTAPHP